MNKTYSTVLSSLVLSGTVFVMAPHAWSQAGGASGAGSQSGSKSDSSATGSSSQRGATGSGSEMQSQREQGGAARAGASRMSKEDVKQVQAALKNKGMDPGPEDGVLGPKTQQALREFQKSNNIPATGRIDEKTASALGVDVGGGTGGSSSGMGSSSSSTPSGAGAGTKSGASQPSSGSKSGSTSK